ncbi:hypothetical protein J6590_060183 [Homalodisca vitripennis]|nr:hypothetical protein J6590_060183 [Homalodisca vitripennis]
MVVIWGENLWEQGRLTVSTTISRTRCGQGKVAAAAYSSNTRACGLARITATTECLAEDKAKTMPGGEARRLTGSTTISRTATAADKVKSLLLIAGARSQATYIRLCRPLSNPCISLVFSIFSHDSRFWDNYRIKQSRL